jgi:hypothetical protein
MGDVSGLEKPKGVIGGFWKKLVASAEAVTDADEIVLFAGYSSGASAAALAGGAAFGALGAVVGRLISGSGKSEGIASTLPTGKTVLVVLTDRRVGVGPQKATPDAMSWVVRKQISNVTAEGTKLRVTFSDGSERVLAFQANSKAPLATAVARFSA